MRIKRNFNHKAIKASSVGKIPYDLVSTLVILRDWLSADEMEYMNDEHEKLVSVADFLYNADLPADKLKPEAKAVYDKYGKNYFNKVLKDVAALDSQVTSDNINDLIDEYNAKEASYTGVKASTTNRKRRAIKADVDYFQMAVNVFNNSLNNLNEYFKGDVTFKAVVGDVFGAKHTGLYEDDGEAFMLDLQNLVNANGYSVLVNDYLTEYLQHPLYLAVINGTQEQYISEYISGEDMDNIDPTVAYGMVDEWWNTFNYDCYNLAWEIADTIAKYLTNFSMIVEDIDVSYYENGEGEIELTEDYGDWIIE